MKTEGKLRVIEMSDIHWGDGDPVLLYSELHEEFFGYVRPIAEEIDVLMLPGDYFHRKLSLNEPAAKLALKFFDELLQFCYENDIKLRMLQGTITHDFNQLDNFKHHEVNFDFRIITTVQDEEIFPDVWFLYVPEEYMENWEEYYSDYLPPQEGTKYDMIFGHGTFDFAAFDNQQQESERPIKNAPVFKYKDFKDWAYGPVVFGHIHGRQAYKDKIFYAGSFTRTCHGEPKPKGFIDISYDTTDLTYKVKFVENKKAPEFKTLKISDIVSEESSIEEKVEAIKKAMEESENVKIKLDASVDSAELALLKETFSATSAVKIDVSERLEKEKEEMEDDRYDYITKRELPIPDTIHRFLKEEKGVEIPLEKIEEILKEEDSDDE